MAKRRKSEIEQTGDELINLGQEITQGGYVAESGPYKGVRFSSKSAHSRAVKKRGIIFSERRPRSEEKDTKASKPPEPPFTPKGGAFKGVQFASRKEYRSALRHAYGFESRQAFREYVSHPQARLSLALSRPQEREVVLYHLSALHRETRGRAAASFRDTSPDSALARYLVAIGRRDPDADYPVGETPRR